MSSVRVSWLTACLDTPREWSQESDRFWLQATGTCPSGRSGDRDQFMTLLPSDGDPYLRAQVTDSGTCGVHVGLHVRDVVAASGWARSLDAQITSNYGALAILESPGGLPFCLVAHGGANRRPQPSPWSEGHHSLLDQVCLDIPEHQYDEEAAFWSAMTQWPLHPGSRPRVRLPGSSEWDAAAATTAASQLVRPTTCAP